MCTFVQEYGFKCKSGISLLVSGYSILSGPSKVKQEYIQRGFKYLRYIFIKYSLRLQINRVSQ